MKRKMIFLAVVFLLIVNIQTVFTEAWNPNEIQFCEYFDQQDLSSMERVLRENRNRMDLSALLYSVIGGYSLNNHPNIAPINTNRSIAVLVIQLLAKYGVDFNVTADYYYCKYRPDMTIGVTNAYLLDIFGLGSLYILQKAIYDNLDISIIRALLEGGADMYRFNYNVSDNSLFSFDDNKIAIARLLIENGYNVNSIYAEGVSLLQYAATRGKIGIVRLLVESGAMVNYTDGKRRTAAQAAYEEGYIDIYNYLKQNGAVWTAPSQVASAPPSSSQQPRSTYNDDYTPPPSSSSSSSTPDRNIGREIAEAFRSPLQSGTYALAGTQARIRLTAIARSGIFTYTNRQGRTGTGSYSIDGNRMTIQMEGYTYLYTVTSETSFSGSDGTWVRTGY
ncbi:MAG: ankyrin repeat domain-containing protein [Treponema sp.]|jgi:hypothetical protein|nr:ankyrin repeat domain-containing protein [Treponema sp.]